MAADYLKYASGNSPSTTLSSSITGADTSAPLTSDTNFAAKSGEGMVILDEGQATEELAYATGKVGSSLTIPLANRGLEGGSAQPHSFQASVKGVITAGMWNNVIDALSLVVNKVSGALNKATAAEVATGTDDAKIVTPLAAAPYANNSLYRQALINGNFDVWQRGTSYNSGYTDSAAAFLSDRWEDRANDDGGTRPTLTRSRQALTAGDIPGSFYFSRLAFDGAGTSLGVNSYHRYTQGIEHGVRLLCGLNKKVTVSFWARSDVANKRISPTLFQDYGTGGSPTSTEIIKGTPITLTSTWTKYTQTFTTNTLVGKTFGTANDDVLRLAIYYVWGTTSGNTEVQTSVTAETYVGAGYVDIAQVQLVAGDVALPFMPKSFEEELRACMRYCYQINRVAESFAFMGIANSATATRSFICTPVNMRSSTLTLSTSTITSDNFYLMNGPVNVTAMSFIHNAGNLVTLEINVSAGLTAGNAYALVMKAANSYIRLEAEL